MRTRRMLTQLILIVVLTALLCLSLVPFAMMLLLSLKSNAQIFAHFWDLPQPPRWDFYGKAYVALIGYILNTALVAGATVAGVLTLSSLSGYTFAGREWGPFALLNTRWALILPYIAGGQVFGILLCRGFFQSLPEELFEAARLDGASEGAIYGRIALPLSKPILATIAIMTTLSVYNDYIWPLVVLSDSGLQTFSVGVTRFAGEFNLDYGPTLAGYVIGSLPLLLLFAFGMRYFIQGITAGSLKG